MFALTDVNGLGVAAAEEIEAKAPFTSVADLAARCDARKVTGAKAFLKGATAKEAGGVITKLYESSALDGLREHPLGEKKEKGKK